MALAQLSELNSMEPTQMITTAVMSTENSVTTSIVQHPGVLPPHMQANNRSTGTPQAVSAHNKQEDISAEKVDPKKHGLPPHMTPYPMLPPHSMANMSRQEMAIAHQRMVVAQAEHAKQMSMAVQIDKPAERAATQSTTATAPTCVVHPITTTAQPLKQDALKGPHDLPVSTAGSSTIPHTISPQEIVKEKMKAIMEQTHQQNLAKRAEVENHTVYRASEGKQKASKQNPTPVSAHQGHEHVRPPSVHSHIQKPTEHPPRPLSAQEQQYQVEQFRQQMMQKGMLGQIPPGMMPAMIQEQLMRAARAEVEKKGAGPVDLQKIVAPSAMAQAQRQAASSTQGSGHHPQIQSPALAQTAPSPHQISQSATSPTLKKVNRSLFSLCKICVNYKRYNCKICFYMYMNIG